MAEELIIEPGRETQLDTVKGNLKVGDGATLIASKGTIIVTGNIVSRGSFVVEGSLEAGSVRCKNGSLEVEGDLKDAKYLSIDKRLAVEGNVTSPEIKVGGSISVEKDLQSS